MGGGGGHGLIVPKSFLYASNWKKLRAQLLDGLEIIADCGRGWDEVLLEQVIFIHRKDAKTKRYRNLKRQDRGFDPVGSVDKRECRRFGFLLNDIAEEELNIARQMLKSGKLLREYIINRRGAGLQSELQGLARGNPVLAGTNIQRYHLSGDKGYHDLGDVPENAYIKAGNILAQNIITRLKNPTPHIRIVAHLVQKDETRYLILDTVNQIEVSSTDLSPYFALALLNSKLINWYVYRFIYAKATLTMHFDSPITNRIPLPDFTAQPELVAKIIAEVHNIYADRQASQNAAQTRIDKHIFQLYDLCPAQIALVQANMPN